MVSVVKAHQLHCIFSVSLVFTSENKVLKLHHINISQDVSVCIKMNVCVHSLGFSSIIDVQNGHTIHASVQHSHAITINQQYVCADLCEIDL